MTVLDLFAGPGGWDEGLRWLGITDVLGVEWEPTACATAEAAGHYLWKGSRTRQYEQVGNAVPPLLAAHIAAEALGVAESLGGAA